MREDGTDATIKALVDPGRRAILDALRARDGRSATELGEVIPGLGRHAVLKHVGILERANLVTTAKVGRRRLVYLNPVPLIELARRWLDEFSAKPGVALVRLRHHLEQENLMSNLAPASGVAPAPASRTVRASIVIHATPAEVWRALTDPALTAQWYFGTSIRSTFVPGEPLDYVSDEGTVQIRGIVTEVERERRLLHTFAATWSPEVSADEESLFEWNLEPMGAMTRVSIYHSHISAGSQTEDEVEEGATVLLSALKTLLETGRPLPVGM